MSVHEQYFEWVREYEARYGAKTLVMAEMGSFMEMMCADEDPGLLRVACDLLNLTLTRRNKTAGAGVPATVSNPWLAGFPSASLERYARILVERGFTVVVATQIPVGKGKFERTVTEVLSPSTYIAAAAEGAASTGGREPSVVALLWTKEPCRRVVEGFLWTVSMVSVSTFTGAIQWSQAFSTWFDQQKARDDAAAFLSAMQPSELLVGGGLDASTFASDGWAAALGIQPDLTPVHALGEAEFGREEARAALWESIYGRSFQEGAGAGGVRQFEKAIGFWGDEGPARALCATLRFLWNHHESLVRRVPLPTAWGSGSEPMSLQLEANAAQQLQIEDVFQFLSANMGPMGRRAVRQRLLVPLLDRDEMDASLDRIERWRAVPVEVRRDLRGLLQETGDWERIHRKISLRKASPGDIARLCRGLMRLPSVWPKDDGAPIPAWCAEYAATWEARVCTEHLSAAGAVPRSPLTFVSSRWTPTLRSLWERSAWLERWMEALAAGARRGMDDPTWLKWEENERDGRFLSITSKRWNTRKAAADDLVPLPDGMADDQVGRALLDEWIAHVAYRRKDAVEWTAAQATGSQVRVSCPLLRALFESFREGLEAIASELADMWMRLLEEIEADWGDRWRAMHQWWAGEDVALEMAELSLRHGYVRPRWTLEESGSGIEARGLRHLLLERRATKEAYVPNNVALGTSGAPNTVLLYGVNACGKSSLGRALGIAVVMAQAGLFVAATECWLGPFARIVCRILGNDDPTKGLSSFAVEMEEMRAILQRADERTLVLMDEPCRGTEADSAQALVAACVHHLHARGARTWVATHLHGLAQLPEVRGVDGLAMKHLAVSRDASGRLVYERVLREGPGPSSYGIDVARAMGLPADVLALADNIRRREEGRGSDPRGRPSRYHGQAWVADCAICGARADHVHHRLEQYTADEWGLVEPGLHKNHLSNLVPLCERCHDATHRGKIVIEGYRQTSTGIELEYRIAE